MEQVVAGVAVVAQHLEALHVGEGAAGLELALVQVMEEGLALLSGQPRGLAIFVGAEQVVKVVGHLLFGDEPVDMVEHEGEEDFTGIEGQQPAEQIEPGLAEPERVDEGEGWRKRLSLLIEGGQDALCPASNVMSLVWMRTLAGQPPCRCRRCSSCSSSDE